MDLETKMRNELIKFLVQKHIFCPFSEQFEGVTRVLDVRTCVVVLDPDGDPKAVMAPEAWESLKAQADAVGQQPLGEGFSIMERS